MAAHATILHRHANGFVTDTGEEQHIADISTGATLGWLERYGVWKWTGAKWEVVLVTGDKAQAIAAAEEK